jgi:hypothetical protein
MQRTLVVAVTVSLVALAGCGGLTDTAGPGGNETVAVADKSAGATDVNQTFRIAVDGSTADTEWTSISATYPRDRFAVGSTKHEDIVLGVDTDGDGEMDREFDERHVSGVNNNEFSLDITLETGYTLQESDVVVVTYPAVDNPSEPGEYAVEITLNGRQTTIGTVVIE